MAEVGIVNRKVARRARTRQTFPLGPQENGLETLRHLVSALIVTTLKYIHPLADTPCPLLEVSQQMAPTRASSRISNSDNKESDGNVGEGASSAVRAQCNYLGVWPY